VDHGVELKRELLPGTGPVCVPAPPGVFELKLTAGVVVFSVQGTTV